MADQEQLAIIRTGSKAWNAWRRSHREAIINLEEAELAGTDLSGANLTGANLRRANLLEAYLDRTRLRRADLAGSYLVDARVTRADLRESILDGADLAESNFSEADLTKADLRKANLWETTFCGAVLDSANFELGKLSQANLGGVIARKAYFVEADLQGTFLEEADLRESNFFEADLRRARLRGADLEGAFLNGVKLQEADLTEADLTGADLGGTNFGRACLQGADLSSSHLAKTYFGDSNLGGTTFYGVDLSDTLGLGAAIHYAPSRIDLETLAQSHGRIPESFLHGIGIPIPFADHLVAFNWERVRYRSCFISYSTRDREFAAKLHTDLHTRGISCWLDAEDILPGPLRDQLLSTVDQYDRFILVLSESSLQSRWVRTEFEEAVKRHTKADPVILPIRLLGYDMLDKWNCIGSDGTDLAAIVRDNVIPDFSNWRDPELYEKSLKIVLRGLEIHPQPPAGDE